MGIKYYYLRCSDCKERICHAQEYLPIPAHCTIEEIAYNTLDLFDRDAWNRIKRKKDAHSERLYGGKKHVFADDSSVPERKPLLVKHYKTKAITIVPQPLGRYREVVDREKMVILMHSPITGNAICMDGVRRPDEYAYFEMDVDGPNEKDVERKLGVMMESIEDNVDILSSPLTFAGKVTPWDKFKARMPPFLRTRRFFRYMKRKWYEYMSRGHEEDYETRFMETWDRLKQQEENESYVRELAIRGTLNGTNRREYEVRQAEIDRRMAQLPPHSPLSLHRTSQKHPHVPDSRPPQRREEAVIRESLPEPRGRVRAAAPRGRRRPPVQEDISEVDWD